MESKLEEPEKGKELLQRAALRRKADKQDKEAPPDNMLARMHHTWQHNQQKR